MDAVNWPVFIEKSMYGIRTYLMKEDPKNIPAARKRFQRSVEIRDFNRTQNLFVIFSLQAQIYSLCNGLLV